MGRKKNYMGEKSVPRYSNIVVPRCNRYDVKRKISLKGAYSGGIGPIREYENAHPYEKLTGYKSSFSLTGRSRAHHKPDNGMLYIHAPSGTSIK